MKIFGNPRPRANAHSIEAELSALRSDIESLQQTLRLQAQTLNQISKQHDAQLKLMDGMRNAALHPLRAEVFQSMSSKQLSMMETLQVVQGEKLSLARFGDGELRMALYADFDIKFQRNSMELHNELREILQDTSRQVLLTLPELSRDRFWTDFWAAHWYRLHPMINWQPRWGHTQVTRREFFGTFAEEAVQAWNSVWADRKALLVAGKGSRFQMVDQLFGSLTSVTPYDAPATNAYAEIDRIETEILNEHPEMVLVALGPAGTVLAHRLAGHGIQTLDIGHITAVWQQVFEGAGSPESRPTARPV